MPTPCISEAEIILLILLILFILSDLPIRAAVIRSRTSEVLRASGVNFRPLPRGGPDFALDVWVTKEQEGLKGERVPRNLLLLCNPDAQSSVCATPSPKGNTMTQWFYMKDGLEVGPVDTSELKRLAACGQLSPTDTIWREGLEAWIPASKAKGLFPVGVPSRSPANTHQVISSVHSQNASPELLSSEIVAPRTADLLEESNEPKRVIGYRRWVLLGGIGVPALLAVAALVWFFGIRDTWEGSHGKEIVRLSSETMNLIRANKPAEGITTTEEVAAIAKYEELLSYVGTRQVTDISAIKAMAEARAAAESVKKRLLDKRQMDEQRKKDEESRAKEEQQMASVKAQVTGGAWLTKKAGNSEPLRGLNIYFIRSQATTVQKLAMLTAQIRETKATIDATISERRSETIKSNEEIRKFKETISELKENVRTGGDAEFYNGLIVKYEGHIKSSEDRANSDDGKVKGYEERIKEVEKQIEDVSAL